MMKEKLAAILLVLCIFLIACGEPAKKNPAAFETPSAETEQETPAEASPEEIKEESPAVPEAEELSEEVPEEGPRSFALGETLVCEGLCELSDLYAEVLDDAAMAEDWYYYYTDSDQSPATTLVWAPSEGNYTTVEVLFSVKNTSGEARTFGDKLTAQLLYQESESAELRSFEGTVFQQNPGQVDESGEIVMWSTKFCPIPAGESANASFRFDVPEDVYGKILAAAKGECSGVREVCEFTLADKTFCIDLAQVLIPASEYEF